MSSTTTVLFERPSSLSSSTTSGVSQTTCTVVSVVTSPSDSTLLARKEDKRGTTNRDFASTYCQIFRSWSCRLLPTELARFSECIHRVLFLERVRSCYCGIEPPDRREKNSLFSLVPANESVRFKQIVLKQTTSFKGVT